MMTSYFRIGGIALEPPLDFLPRVTKFIAAMNEKVDEYENLLTKNSIWVNRTTGVGYISKEDAIAYGVTGASARGSGVDWDLRRDMPYCGYDEVHLQRARALPRATFTRAICVRIAEMREVVKIVKQALEKLRPLADAPYKADAPKIILPDREKMKTQMESLIYHFKIVTEGFAVPAGEVYSAIESPRGEMGWYVVSDGTAKPVRVHMRAPSFANLQALSKMCVGRLLGDVVAAIGSIDIVLGEIDR